MKSLNATHFISADRNLAQRLEYCEGFSGADFIEARSRAFPGGRAEWIEVAGTYVMFDGPESPLTQTFGLGMSSPISSDDFDRIENFFRERGAPIFHEVSP